jgi:hypothetical protein
MTGGIPNDGGLAVITDPAAELAELRQTNERLRRKVDFLFDRLGLVYTDQDVPLYVLHAQELIRAGQYADALRVVREHTAVGIVEARLIVTQMSARLGVLTPTDAQLGVVAAHDPWADAVGPGGVPAGVEPVASGLGANSVWAGGGWGTDNA